MESVEKLQRGLESLEELRTIVRTMEALSAASIRQYEQAVAALAGYYRTVELGLHVVLRDMEPPRGPPARPRSAPRIGAILFGSDHGLCGRFNEEITEFALQRMDASESGPADPLVLAVGARVAASLAQQGTPPEEDFFVPGSTHRITATVRQILLKVDDWREQGGVHGVYLFYNRHSGARGNYRPTGIELLPVNLRRFHRLEETAWPSRRLPTFTMDRERLFSHLLRQYFFVSIFRACAESQASEHASRLSAMQSADRNLEDRFEELTTLFRRARQDAITSELLDVVAGFEAIAGDAHQRF